MFLDIKYSKAGCGGPGFVIVTLGRQTQADNGRFEASLIYIMSFRQAGAKCETVSQKQTIKKKSAFLTKLLLISFDH